MARLRDVVAVLDELYPPGTAADWDAVGPVVGDPDAPVGRVLLAVDPVAAVVDEAIDWGADLLLTHHPLYLRGTSTVYAGTAKGLVVHRLVAAGCGLVVAHTNADVAADGVAQALADVLGLVDAVPLRPEGGPGVDKLTVYVPVADADRLVDALAAAGAGTVGAYDRCAYWTDGTGTFRPGAAAHPAIGAVGRVEEVPERRVEMVLPRQRRAAVVRALLAAHPYEEPAFDLVETAPRPGSAGTGRVGELAEPTTLAQFAACVAAVLPRTPAGLRVAGEPSRSVRRVAVCGGAGDAYLADAVRAGADAYVTADLRHHPVSEHLESGGPALLDPGHWASEWPWLPRVGAALTAALGTVETRVSTIVTDPWTLHLSAPTRTGPTAGPTRGSTR
ncbi:MAG: Nif3-like dinuclear metal center hexameric protein [Actinomycetia bacterium]|nr:Nif3-like dinuclear metal center hexameric protein [Actinomycetes bacterium]